MRWVLLSQIIFHGAKFSLAAPELLFRPLARKDFDMDDSLKVSLAVVIIAQVVTLAVTFLTLRHQSIQAEKQRHEAQRAEWKSYLIHLMERLIDARRDYEQFLCTSKQDEERHGAIIGMAISVCLAANDTGMLACVEGDDSKQMDGLTPYFVPKGYQQDGKVAREDWESRNRKAMQEAVKLLADMIKRA